MDILEKLSSRNIVPRFGVFIIFNLFCCYRKLFGHEEVVEFFCKQCIHLLHPKEVVHNVGLHMNVLCCSIDVMHGCKN